MFHMLEKEHAEEVDKKADEQYRKRCNEVLAHSKVLYKTRQEAMEQLKACDAYMQPHELSGGVWTNGQNDTEGLSRH